MILEHAFFRFPKFVQKTTTTKTESSLGLLGLGKGNRLVNIVEDSVVLSHEYIAQDPLGTRSGKVHTHKDKQASSLGLNDRLFSRNGVFVSSNGKDDVGNLAELLAINRVLAHNVGCGSHCLGQFGNLLLRSRNQGRTGIDNGGDLVTGIVAVRSGLDSIQRDLPVGCGIQLDRLQATLELGRIVSSKGQFSGTIVSKIKGEDGLIHLVLLNGILKDGRRTSYTNGCESQAKDAIKLSKAVRQSQSSSICHLGKLLSVDDKIVREEHIVQGEESFDTTTAIHDFKVGSVLGVRGALVVVEFVFLANDGKSAVRASDLGDPQIGRSSVENDHERLRRATNLHHAKVLGVGVVLDDLGFFLLEHVNDRTTAEVVAAFALGILMVQVQDGTKAFVFTLEVGSDKFFIRSLVKSDAGQIGRNRRGQEKGAKDGGWGVCDKWGKVFIVWAGRGGRKEDPDHDRSGWRRTVN